MQINESSLQGLWEFNGAYEDHKRYKKDGMELSIYNAKNNNIQLDLVVDIHTKENYED